MKTTTLATLLAALSFAAIPANSALAYSFNGNSKHGSVVQSSASTFDEALYAKYSWLSSDDNQPAPTVVVNHIIVSIPDQRLYAYHDQQLVQPHISPRATRSRSRSGSPRPFRPGASSPSRVA